ncbi:synaptogenesis protein syg-1-like [Ptychodera flava]|uniref:synaptogenesis protein syg-1-like n=1 Tax=Ptychodera flava TaxID=63121 RepID=UPI00396A68B9
MTIEMSCKVENLKSDQKVSWLKGLDYTVISDDHDVRTHYLTDNERYFIVGDESQGEYNLQIRMVSYQTAEFDSGLYHCAVFYDDPNILHAIIRSAFARLNVYVVPRVMYPQCTVDDVNATDTSEVMEGEAVTLSCQSDAGYPTVSMSWENGNSSTILTESVTVQDDKASVEYTWIPNENDDGAFFICSIYHMAFDCREESERNRSALSGLLKSGDVHQHGNHQYL